MFRGAFVLRSGEYLGTGEFLGTGECSETEMTTILYFLYGKGKSRRNPVYIICSRGIRSSRAQAPKIKKDNLSTETGAVWPSVQREGDRPVRLPFIIGYSGSPAPAL